MNSNVAFAPTILNWKELVEKFGLRTPIGKDYKTAIEISRDLKSANERWDLNDKSEQPKVQKKGIITYVAKEANEMSCIMIACEKENFDSAVCTFQFIKMNGNIREYEYIGTAK